VSAFLNKDIFVANFERKVDIYKYVYLLHSKLKRNMLVICTYLVTKQIFQNKLCFYIFL